MTEKSPKQSTKMIRVQYYASILVLIASPLSIIGGLISGNSFSWMLGSIMLVIALIQYPKRKKEMDNLSKTVDNDSLTILKNRLAKGEISKEEYEDLKKTLDK